MTEGRLRAGSYVHSAIYVVLLYVAFVDRHDDLGFRAVQGEVQGCSLAAVWLLENLHALIVGKRKTYDVGGSIFRTVIDDEQLDPHRLGQYPADDLFNRRPLIVDGHHDRQQGILENPAQPSHQRPIE